MGVVVAMDLDRGVDDNVIYSITSGNNLIGGNDSFAINSSTGVIYVNVDQLDRETHLSYTLTVEVSHVMLM